MYRIIRVVSDNKNFLVLEAEHTVTKKTEICYVSRELDLEKELFTEDELQIVR